MVSTLRYQSRTSYCSVRSPAPVVNFEPFGRPENLSRSITVVGAISSSSVVSSDSFVGLSIKLSLSESVLSLDSSGSLLVPRMASFYAPGPAPKPFGPALSLSLAKPESRGLSLIRFFLR